jgi:hypothetical protein
MFERELGKIREPDNATLIDSWIQAIQAFVHGSKLGPTSRNRDQRALEAALDSVVPVDPLTRWL